MQLLDWAYERYGRLRTSLWVTLGCFAVICVTSLLILTELVLTPLIADLPYSASSDMIIGLIFPWIMAFALLLIVAASALLHFGLLVPVERRRAQLLGELKNAPPREQIQHLMHERHELNNQLDSVLDDNLAMRDELTALRLSQQFLSDRQEAVIKATDDRLLLTDEKGIAIAASAAMATVMGVRSNEVAGKPASELLRLYDAGKERPLEYPIRSLVKDTITRASTIPQLQQVLLMDQAGKQQRLMISAEAIVARSGKVSGALVRLESLESAAEARGATAHAQRDITTDLPMREEFERRLTELVNIAANQDATHSLALVTVDNMQSIYDGYGYWAGEELLWHVSRLMRDELDPQAELYRVTAMHFAVLMAFESPSHGAQQMERVRLAIDAQDFAWQNRQYRSSISIAVTAIDESAQGNSALMSLADSELRLARQLGGNRVQTHVTDDLLAETQQIEKKLLGWLDSDSGEASRLQLQSMALSSGKTGQDKALILAMLRVEMEDGFWVDPAAFVSSAEQSGLSSRIDAWLVEHTLQAMAAKPELDAEFGQVLVPISGESMVSDHFADDLMGIVAASGVAPERLVLVLEEAFASARTSVVTRFVSRLESLGIGIALSGCRVGNMSTLAARLKPALLLLHSTVYAKPADPACELQLEYSRGVASSRGCQLVVAEALKEEKSRALHKLGVDFVGAPTKGFGPLSAFGF